MDLNQSKLSKNEWNSTEISVSQTPVKGPRFFFGNFTGASSLHTTMKFPSSLSFCFDSLKPYVDHTLLPHHVKVLHEKS